MVHRYLHYGLTSSDVLDTTTAVQLRDATDILIADWKALVKKLEDLARQHQGTVMAGRTHGVHAEPTTFGIKAAGWLSEARRNLPRMERAREIVAYGKLSGAVGTFSQLPPKVEAEVCKRMGISPEPISTQVIPRDRHADY